MLNRLNKHHLQRKNQKFFLKNKTTVRLFKSCYLFTPGSFDRETTSLLHGLRQFFVEHLIRLIWRYVDSVETSMCLGKVLRWGFYAMNSEKSRARRASTTCQRKITFNLQTSP